MARRVRAGIRVTCSRGGDHRQHPLDAIEELVARIPGLVDLREQHVDVLDDLFVCPHRRLDPIEQLMAGVTVVAYPLDEDVVITLLQGWHWFLLAACYIRSPSGPRLRFRSSSRRPKWRLSSSIRSDRARNVRPSLSISASVRLPASTRRRAWRSISCRSRSTSVSTSCASPCSTRSGSAFTRFTTPPPAGAAAPRS